MRKKERTRALLQSAALRLAVERGADRVTVADIAAAADVSPRTYFNYFSSREEAFVADDLDRGRRLVELVTAAPAGSAVWPVLRGAALEAFGASAQPREEELLKQQLLHSSPEVLAHVLSTFDPLERQLVHELRQRVGAEPRTLPHLLANSLIAAVRAAIETWLAAPDADFQQVLSECFDVLAPAFVPAAGSQPDLRPA
jgi:AcrR family transcriptional regulator